MVGRVTVVNLMNYGCGNGAGCFEVKVWVFVENKTKAASGVGCSERAVLYIR